MIYITGDKHGDYRDVFAFCQKNKTTVNDMIIILGDAGINYFLNIRDDVLKESLSFLPLTLFCIHGNHEERPENIPSYEEKSFCDGVVYYEKEYPNIIFAKDGEIYNFDGVKTLVIGGAYSIDKEYRLAFNYPWYASEQPNEEIKERVRKTLIENNHKVDVIMSHTCPLKYIPFEAFLPGYDESKVDKSTEKFLDEIEEGTDYQRWYCGHFHTDKEIDKIKFMMNDVDEIKNYNKKFVKTK